MVALKVLTQCAARTAGWEFIASNAESCVGIAVSRSKTHSLTCVRRYSWVYRCLHEFLSLHAIHEAVTEAELFCFVPRYPRTPQSPAAVDQHVVPIDKETTLPCLIIIGNLQALFSPSVISVAQSA
jgi:hypothetical protein